MSEDTIYEFTDDDWLTDDNEIEVDEFGIVIDKSIENLLSTAPSIEVVDDTTDSTNITVEKVKRPKKVVDPFVKMCKKYFSSLNSRSAKYAVFNLNEEYKNKLVMMSSKNKSTFDDYLYQYMPGDLNIQIVEFKNDDLTIIKERLCISDDYCVLINLSAVLKYINIACRHEDTSVLPMKLARTDNNDIYLKVVDPKTEQTYIERVGFTNQNWRVVVILQALTNLMVNKNNPTCVVSDTVTYNSLIPYIDQNLIVYPILTNRYKDSDGKPIFDYVIDEHTTKLYLIDGKDTISVKEYLKKLKKEYTLEIISFVCLPDKCIFYQTRYEDDENIVISSRPYVSAFPMCITDKEFKK